jgi:PAS domain-containing protein
MSEAFTTELTARALELIARHRSRRVALLGDTPTAWAVRSALEIAGLADRVVAVFDRADADRESVRSLRSLAEAAPDLLIVCDDAGKESLLLAAQDALSDVSDLPNVALAGVAHLDFHDDIFDELDAPALVPSYATGSPHTRVHLFQCLKAAAAAGLSGAIVEFGAFKGGTTAWLARTADRLGLSDSRVIGFDTWDGFPPRRSLLDLYEHPRCVFTDVDAVRAYTEPLGVELVPGDIAETYVRLRDEPILLAFFDTDNYSPTRAALHLCAEQIVGGGALVFDHVATTGDYVDTVGERLAAFEVLEPLTFLNLHGTGVFIKLPTA